jgi:hypothetical protein
MRTIGISLVPAILLKIYIKAVFRLGRWLSHERRQRLCRVLEKVADQALDLCPSVQTCQAKEAKLPHSYNAALSGSR